MIVACQCSTPHIRKRLVVRLECTSKAQFASIEGADGADTSHRNALYTPTKGSPRPSLAGHLKSDPCPASTRDRRPRPSPVEERAAPMQVHFPVMPSLHRARRFVQEVSA